MALRQPEFEALNTTVLAITTEQLRGATGSIEALGIRFPMLYDPTASVPKAYAVFNLHGDSLASASTFLIDRSGHLRWSQVGKSYDAHASSESILGALRRVYHPP